MNAKILIVEDDPDTLLALTLRLETNGFAVLHAVDVMTAISMARAESPDLIVLDLGLPDGDGYTVIKQLKSGSTDSSIPVIVLTARDPEGNQELSYDLGAFDFFQKPVPYNWFLASVKKAVAERAGKKALST